MSLADDGDDRRPGPPLRDAIASWIAGHEDDVAPTQLRLSGVSGYSLLLQASSRRMHMSVPCSHDEVFLVTAADPDVDPSFNAALMTLNEKLERLRPADPHALFVAMEYLVTALKKLQENLRPEPSSPNHGPARESGDAEADSDNTCDGDACDDDDEMAPDEVDFGYDMASFEDLSMPSSAYMKLRSKGFLYAMAMEAKQQCNEARQQFGNPSCLLDVDGSTSSETALAWCIVKPNPAILSIEIRMQIGGIMHDDAAAASLGLPLDVPMHILLQINKDFWGRAHQSAPLRIDGCIIRSGPSDHSKVPMVRDTGGGTSQKPKTDVGKAWDSDQRHKFGEEVLVPDLVFCFFKYLERKDHSIAKSSDVLRELKQFSAISNPILGLIHFLAARFRALPNWCVACWDTLPHQVGRLRTCDKDLCLYRFEELGLGTALLQEVRKCPELIDFELSLAIAAAASSRDVFEPFPAFLLVKEEIRDRSGWFGKKSRPDANSLPQTTASHPPHASYRRGSHQAHSNKNFCVLKSVLNAYPSLEEMQRFHDERDLKKELTRLWLKALRTQENGVSEDWKQKKWLPYDVLRFLISSNRLTMCCLQDPDTLLQIQGTIYQFAVLHDNPEKEAHFQRRRTEKGGSFFAFHGSAVGNWFSILRNGLRSLSNTSYMSTGATYGAGIYIADSISISLGYAVQGFGWKLGKMHSPFSVLAICEVVDGSLVSDLPQHGIMVVRPECEQDVLIRYILVLSPEYNTLPNRYSAFIRKTQLQFIGSADSRWTDLLEHHSHLRRMHLIKQQSQWRDLTRTRWLSLLAMCNEEAVAAEEAVAEEDMKPQTLSQVAVSGSKTMHSTHAMPGCMQAIQRELKNIVSQINAAKRTLQWNANMPILALITIDLPDETNLQRWHVDLSQDLFKESPLYQDFQNFRKSTSVKLECLFPDSFPMEPPFIRVMSPRFRFHTGHITVGGSICMELLTKSGWSPAFCFESILVQIVNAMIEGGARLDWNSPMSEYSMAEAQAAFDRVARDHGWIKGK